jgi:hypothetical protein
MRARRFGPAAAMRVNIREAVQISSLKGLGPGFLALGTRHAKTHPLTADQGSVGILPAPRFASIRHSGI